MSRGGYVNKATYEALSGKAALAYSDYRKVETALWLLFKMGGADHAERGYLLLENYQLIGGAAPGDLHLLQQAHKNLSKIAPKSRWLKALDAYGSLPDFRRFELLQHEGSLILAPVRPLENVEELEREILDERAVAPSAPKAVTAGRSYLYDYAPLRRKRPDLPSIPQDQVEVRFSAEELELLKAKGSIAPGEEPEHIRAPELIFSREELLDAAKAIDESLEEPYLQRVFESCSLSAVDGDYAQESDGLRLKDLTHLVGMVGSGKSVLMRTLAAACARRGLKTVLVQPTVADALQTVDLLRRAGIDAVPVIGKRGRIAYLDQQAMRSTDGLVSPELGRFLDSPCLLDGRNRDVNLALSYDDLPCLRLLPKDGKAETRATCPYFGFCPGSAMIREAPHAQVIATTPQGFLMTRIGVSSRPLYEIALNEFDLVVFDECDQTQRTYDGLLAPVADYADLIASSADALAEDARRRGEARLTDPERTKFNGLLHTAGLMLDRLLYQIEELKRRREAIQKAVQGAKPTVDPELRREASSYNTWYSVLCGTFSANRLLELLTNECVEGALPTSLCRELSGYAAEPQHPRTRLLVEMVSSPLGNADITDAFARWMEAGSAPKEELDARIDDPRILTAVATMAFEQHMRMLSGLGQTYADNRVRSSFLDVLLYRFRDVQKLLPSSPLGNLFGLRYRPEKKTLEVFRQHALGRELMCSLPWLRTDEDNRPLGPRTLLMSGTSYVPGCLENHVERPVDYILEAPAQTRSYLARARFDIVATEAHVSGSYGTGRLLALQRAIQDAMPAILSELDRGRKVLLIVGNYDEAMRAATMLNRELRLSRLNAQAIALGREPSGDEDLYPRACLERIADRKERALVAPAGAVARGYNMVDGNGHAVFGSLFFLVRAMQPPSDATAACCKVNGLVERLAREVDTQSAEPEALDRPLSRIDRPYELHKEALRKWHALMRAQTCHGIASLPSWLRLDATATLFDLIVQLYGRMARVGTDLEAEPPHIYFVDGAFRARPDAGNLPVYDALGELRAYLQGLMRDGGAAARTLYRPFFDAYEEFCEREGIRASSFIAKSKKGNRWPCSAHGLLLYPRTRRG